MKYIFLSVVIVMLSTQLIGWFVSFEVNWFWLLIKTMLEDVQGRFLLLVALFAYALLIYAVWANLTINKDDER